MAMEKIIIFSGSILGVYILVYLCTFFVFRAYISRPENRIIAIFLSKVSKIPAMIEVMRPYVADQKAFETMIALHSEVMIYRHDSIYDLLEYNAKIQNQFLFLMKLSVQIPELQKHEYFLYIRDFIIKYDRDMTTRFADFNHATRIWNRFVLIKNLTIIGLLLP